MSLEKNIPTLSLEEKGMADKIKKKFDLDLYKKNEKEKLVSDFLKKVINKEFLGRVEGGIYNEEDVLEFSVAFNLSEEELELSKKIDKADVGLHTYLNRNTEAREAVENIN